MTCSPAFKMSEYTYDVLEKYGPQAIEDIRCHKVTKAVEDITFINIAVTGVIANITKSFSQSALGHMMYDGVRTFFTKEAEAALHGEIVAVALFAQLYYNQLEGEVEQLKRSWNVWTCPLPWMTWAWRAMRKTLGFWKNISLIHLMWGRMRKASGACTGPWGRWGRGYDLLIIEKTGLFRAGKLPKGFRPLILWILIPNHRHF